LAADTDIFIWADILPIAGILADICQRFGRYSFILANILPIPI
jgi:hypothetical protein